MRGGKSETGAQHESIYPDGIGGAAMAPLAGMLAERGYRVTGSDTGVYPPASTLLEKLGIAGTPASRGKSFACAGFW